MLKRKEFQVPAGGRDVDMVHKDTGLRSSRGIIRSPGVQKDDMMSGGPNCAAVMDPREKRESKQELQQARRYCSIF
jgi:hypothetical protein